MLILAIESSAVAASVALGKDGTLLAQSVQNIGQTHSKTILPMLEAMVKNCNFEPKDIDAFAVAAGPGSFTGLRIGVSIAKGLAWQGEKPCLGVSTLEAMAHLLSHMEGHLICPVMDARRSQVYNALFAGKGGMPQRLCPDRAISLEELFEGLREERRPVVFMGDGAMLCHRYFLERGRETELAPAHLRMQTAWGVYQAAAAMGEEGLQSPDALSVRYLRLSQAERERLEREQEQKAQAHRAGEKES